MKYKIVQIIPNNVPMTAQYRQDDGSITNSPILLFALIEHENGEREIKAMDVDNELFMFNTPENVSNFVGIKYLNNY